MAGFNNILDFNSCKTLYQAIEEKELRLKLSDAIRQWFLGSSDHDSIETVWDKLKDCLQDNFSGPITYAQLKVAIKKAWDSNDRLHRYLRGLRCHVCSSSGKLKAKRVFWRPEDLTLNQIASILSCICNARNFSCANLTEKTITALCIYNRSPSTLQSSIDRTHKLRTEHGEYNKILQNHEKKTLYEFIHLSLAAGIQSTY